MTEIEAITLCQPFGIIKDIFIKRQKRYAFLQFEVCLYKISSFLLIYNRGWIKLQDAMIPLPESLLLSVATHSMCFAPEKM